MGIKDIGLYIHIPFCYAKCLYCDFFSMVSNDELFKKKYLEALKKEIEIYSQKITDINILSIYIGGGTPTILSGIQIEEILECCYTQFNIDQKIEITIESNPGTFDYKKAKTLFQAGVNRLSIGAQSFSDKTLKKIGRIHNKRDILACYQYAREAGFRNINIDLMFGLPGQTKRQFKKTLTEVINLYPEHISLYALSIESGTPLADLINMGTLKIPSDDFSNELFWEAIAILDEQGYEHYEISNFALPGKRCFHNQIYWKNQEYLGVGAGSTSYLAGKRYQNYRDLKQYTMLLEYDILPIESQEILTEKEKMSETIILQLRMREGLDKNGFMIKFNTPVEKIYSQSIQFLKEQGLLAENETHYFLTKKGISLANNVFMEFLD